MKRLGSLLLAVCLLISVSTIGIIPANAYTPHRLIESGILVGGLDVLQTAIGYVPRGNTVIVIGELFVESRAQLIVEGNLLVIGRINTDDAIISGRNSWQVQPARLWLLGGWILALLGWIVAVVSWILMR